MVTKLLVSVVTATVVVFEISKKHFKKGNQRVC